MDSKRRMVILAEGQFSHHTSKTANGVIRFIPEQVVAIIDSRNVGKTTNDVIGAGGEIPVVRSLDDAMQYTPNALLIGIAPPGGALPEQFKAVIRQAIEYQLDILNGLHTFVGDDREMTVLAEKYRLPSPTENSPDRQYAMAGTHSEGCVGDRNRCEYREEIHGVGVVQGFPEAGVPGGFYCYGADGNDYHR